MNQDQDLAQEKLARSLTAETEELLPFLPYLLQDLWELGSSPAHILAQLQAHVADCRALLYLDLGCDKGAVAVQLVAELRVKVKGVDILPEFIAVAKEKALQFQVEGLCRFEVGDIAASASKERGYGCVIYGAVGDVLGSPKEVLLALKETILPSGYIVYDDAYLNDPEGAGDPKFGDGYLGYDQWMALFAEVGLLLVDSQVPDTKARDDTDTQMITARAWELSQKHPEKKALFDGYVQSQIDESDDLSERLAGVTWLLRKN